MSRARTYPINGDKLRNHILSTGLTLQEASEKLGGSKDYLSGVCRANKATAQCMSLIALALSIPKDLYVIEEKKNEEVSYETDNSDSGDVITLLQEAVKLLQKIEKAITEKQYEQNTFKLPFSDSGDGVHPVGIDGEI